MAVCTRFKFAAFDYPYGFLRQRIRHLPIRQNDMTPVLLVTTAPITMPRPGSSFPGMRSESEAGQLAGSSFAGSK
jgi:hypothetical protein